MGVKDEFHQRAILVCIDELCQRSTKESESMVTANGDVESTTCHAGMAPPPPHRMVESSFQSLERCDKCNKFLRGLLHQGLICHCTSRQLSHINWTAFFFKDSFYLSLWRLQLAGWLPIALAPQLACLLAFKDCPNVPIGSATGQVRRRRRYSLNTSSASSTAAVL